MSTPWIRSRFPLIGTVAVSLLAAFAHAGDPESALPDTVLPEPALPDAALPDAAHPEATRLVTAALQAERDGDNRTRRQLLTQALRAAPEYAPAHWQSGEVPGKGLSWGTFQKAAAAPGERLTEYRNRRSETGTGIPDLLQLADWCHENGLPDAERAHLTQVLALDSDHAAARERLGYVNVNGLWIHSEDFAHAAARQAETAASLEKWGATIEQSVRLLSGVRRQRDRGREQLFGIRDLSAIPAMERLGAAGSEAAGAILIEWLSRLDAYEASQAMARTALASPHRPVRRVATEALRSRPFDEYVPVLLGSLKTPVTSDSRAYVNSRGWVVLDLVFDAEAQGDRRQLVLTQKIGTAKTGRNINPITGRRAITIGNRGLDWGDVRAIRNHLRSNERQAGYARLKWNQLIRETNRRAEMVLRDVTGTRDHAGPVEWWQWWDDYNEVLVNGTKPLRRVHVEAERQYVTADGNVTTESEVLKRQLAVAGSSCLVAGTPVWTEQGLVSIEQIQIGDRVLAQDVDSGELSYQPVLATTVRPPARTFQISTEGIELRATGGHPFWVNGEGWRFARDLKPGMSLHGTDGSQAIKSVEPADEAEAFNLVVADVHTYFIGAGHILSHDNTPRAPTNALVPGLNREL